MNTAIHDTKSKLIKIIETLFHTDEDLNFFLRLDEEDFKKLVSVIIARIGV